MREDTVLNMHKSIVNESPRPGIGRRVAAATMALAAVLGLGACKATGGGYIGSPLDGGPVSVFDGDANYGFNFTCEMRGNQAQIKGQVTYHDSASTVAGVKFPAIRLHGVVDPFFVDDVATCDQAAEMFPNAAQFEGTYRSQDTALAAVPPGRFVIQVFDQGEPGRLPGDFTGDSFSIELLGGPYGLYTRGGFIEGGNIQVQE